MRLPPLPIAPFVLLLALVRNPNAGGGGGVLANIGGDDGGRSDADTAADTDGDGSGGSSSSLSPALSSRRAGAGPVHGRRRPLSLLASNLNNSWLRDLSPETPENRALSRRVAGHRTDDGSSNDVQRPVYNGHYVLPVRTKPLPNARLVIHSPDVASELGLTDDDVSSDEFLGLMSGGDVATHLGTANGTSWSTPYALTIMGERYTHQCPYRTGVGYGDGRASSIGEFILSGADDNNGDVRSKEGGPDRYELQLKGSGPTPFCRSSDGRAVLRSSIREFLASEAMHWLGVPTTRALSLVVSDEGCTVNRPWYSGSYQMPRGQKGDPDVLIEEPCAITCRASRSYVRVGHLDLFARRVARVDGVYNTSSLEWVELERMVWHATYRDFREECHVPNQAANNVAGAAVCLAEQSMDALSSMVAGWIRVGFAQGNFNGDNCLVSGRTVDYGPFGFMEEYDPTFAKWTGSGQHFGFLNQIEAGLANYLVLLESLLPVIEAGWGREKARSFHKRAENTARDLFPEKAKQVFRSKMGFHPMAKETAIDGLWEELELLLRRARADWTVFWRRLSIATGSRRVMSNNTCTSEDADLILDDLVGDKENSPELGAFYKPLSDRDRQDLLSWILKWQSALRDHTSQSCGSEVTSKEDATCMLPGDRMRLSNPKYVLREWMLAEAYTRASPSSYQGRSPRSKFAPPVNEQRDESLIHELYELISDPYGEGTAEQEFRYHRRAPEGAMSAGGTAYMS